MPEFSQIIDWLPLIQMAMRRRQMMMQDGTRNTLPASVTYDQTPFFANEMPRYPAGTNILPIVMRDTGTPRPFVQTPSQPGGAGQPEKQNLQDRLYSDAIRRKTEALAEAEVDRKLAMLEAFKGIGAEGSPESIIDPVGYFARGHDPESVTKKETERGRTASSELLNYMLANQNAFRRGPEDEFMEPNINDLLMRYGETTLGDVERDPGSLPNVMSRLTATRLSPEEITRQQAFAQPTTDEKQFELLRTNEAFANYFYGNQYDAFSAQDMRFKEDVKKTLRAKYPQLKDKSIRDLYVIDQMVGIGASYLENESGMDKLSEYIPGKLPDKMGAGMNEKFMKVLRDMLSLRNVMGTPGTRIPGL